MVVEDDPGVRSLMVDALSYCVNREVVSFEDGLAAWQYLEQGSEADIVIADVDMPGMDGLTLLRKFKSRWDNRIFICMSGRPGRSDEAQAAGADAFLGKPFSINDLFRIVKDYVVD